MLVLNVASALLAASFHCVISEGIGVDLFGDIPEKLDAMLMLWD